MNRQAQACVLLLLGGAVLRASLSDLYLRYVKEGLRPFLIAASLLLIAAAVMTLWYEMRPALRRSSPATSSPATDAAHGDHDDHGHAHHEPRVAWLLILPALGLLLVAPPALGAYAANQSGTSLASGGLPEYPPLPDGDPATITVYDYAVRAVFDKGQSIGDRRVRVTGFTVAGADKQPILTRMRLSCCAADGLPTKVGLSGNTPTGLADDTWIEVTGRYTSRMGRDPINDFEIPYLEVESWRQVPAPRDPYE
ncbi:TIGR03943 family protein [Micromonospora sp. KC213]|uniref:TIGR03943 family putative permease subunit n=1 Tax=Micromonospora sp. KC213 TaxID=2530378 RepID=UPI001046D395|nr:TIGR03943 family protein [Micromonospora sp. KC213]TDC41252.1 TIGR03943 family protein [Micromonospora sp. KC213]